LSIDGPVPFEAPSGSVVIELLVSIGPAPQPRRDEHTNADPDDQDDGPETQGGNKLDQDLSRASAASSPSATRIARAVPAGASAGRRTIRPSVDRRTMAEPRSSVACGPSTARAA